MGRLPLFLLLLIVWCQCGIYIWYTLSCSYPKIEEDAEGISVMIISDVHLLGWRRRRWWIERSWVDWQIACSFHINAYFHPYDLLLILGDQLDEGTGSSSLVAWKSYLDRFFSIFPFPTDNVLYQMGNHDTAFGPSLSSKMLSRFVKAFGELNTIHSFANESFLVLNSMALEDNVDAKIASSTLEYLTSLAVIRKTQGYPPLYLLLHIPLFRNNDKECGRERSLERGHVTYEDPSFEYESGHHVLSQNASIRIMDMLKPTYVFSGHTHAICRYHHATYNVNEYTVPAFSWGMRPDPSLALATLHDGKASIHNCALPDERHVFCVYGIAIISILFVVVRKIGFTTTVQRQVKKVE